jgi:hypothetical protein
MKVAAYDALPVQLDGGAGVGAGQVKMTKHGRVA